MFLAVFSPLGGLPVTWNSFEVYGQELEQELQANLFWSTASETNNDYFSIERSFNAKEFEEIAQVKGAGNSAKINHYKYFDALNLGLTKDVYYRIKQTDYDGKFAYSDIKKLTFTHALENPFQVFYQDRNVYLQSLGNWQENTQLTLVNMLGETVWETTIFAGETPVYPIPGNGSPGIYLLRVNGQSGGYTFKVVLE
ncbi:MAG: T9SS type A sorting domain-containing protein [Bacteroidetes bacterium]|nr:T9SS type A sorting domain-containing protein [Bacteroidota bacterium]